MHLRYYRIILSSAALVAGSSHAGGLWLNEYGDFSGGRAAAGNAAGTGDAASIIYNPAGARDVDSGELFAAAGLIIPSIEFKLESSGPLLGDDDGGSAGELAPGLAMAYVSDLGTEDWDFGLSVGGLAGAGFDYGDSWVGRYQATEVSLLVMAFGASAAYAVNDRLTVGIQPQIFYADLEMDVNLPNLRSPIVGDDSRATLDGSDTGLGFLAGASYQLGDRTRIGIAYQSELDIEFGGELDFRSGNRSELDRIVDTDTDLTMAAKLRASLRHRVSEQLGLDFSVGWDNWSALDSVFVNVDATGGGAGLLKNWEDTYHAAAGVEYAIGPGWELTFGVAYDSNPVDNEDRTADLPVDRQWRYALGARYQRSDDLVIGGYINYADLGEAAIVARGFSGDYDGKNALLSLSLFMNWRL